MVSQKRQGGAKQPAVPSSWIGCELARYVVGAGATISPTRPRTIVCCEGNESGQLKGMSGGRGWYFPEHVE